MFLFTGIAKSVNSLASFPGKLIIGKMFLFALVEIHVVSLQYQVALNTGSFAHT
jgi:hypothetical protein